MRHALVVVLLLALLGDHSRAVVLLLVLALFLRRDRTGTLGCPIRRALILGLVAEAVMVGVGLDRRREVQQKRADRAERDRAADRRVGLQGAAGHRQIVGTPASAAGDGSSSDSEAEDVAALDLDPGRERIDPRSGQRLEVALSNSQVGVWGRLSEDLQAQLGSRERWTAVVAPRRDHPAAGRDDVGRAADCGRVLCPGEVRRTFCGTVPARGTNRHPRGGRSRERYRPDNKGRHQQPDHLPRRTPMARNRRQPAFHELSPVGQTARHSAVCGAAEPIAKPSSPVALIGRSRNGSLATCRRRCSVAREAGVQRQTAAFHAKQYCRFSSEAVFLRLTAA